MCLTAVQPNEVWFMGRKTAAPFARRAQLAETFFVQRTGPGHLDNYPQLYSEMLGAPPNLQPSNNPATNLPKICKHPLTPGTSHLAPSPKQPVRLGPQRISFFRRPGEKRRTRPRGPQPCSKITSRAFTAQYINTLKALSGPEHCALLGAKRSICESIRRSLRASIPLYVASRPGLIAGSAGPSGA